MEPKLLIFYDNELNAIELKQLLAEAGVECLVQEDLKTSVNVMSESSSEFGYAVYVDKSAYKEAKKILDTYEQKREEQNLWCPKCGEVNSTKKIVHHRFGPIWIFIISVCLSVLCLFIRLPLLIYFLLVGFAIFGIIQFFRGYDEEVYHCKSCGHDYKRC